MGDCTGSHDAPMMANRSRAASIISLMRFLPIPTWPRCPPAPRPFYVSGVRRSGQSKAADGCPPVGGSSINMVASYVLLNPRNCSRFCHKIVSDCSIIIPTHIGSRELMSLNFSRSESFRPSDSSARRTSDVTSGPSDDLHFRSSASRRRSLMLRRTKRGETSAGVLLLPIEVSFSGRSMQSD